MAETSAALIEPSPIPETAALLLGTFADLYRQEVAAEEDVHRTLPFFGTALGLVIGALAYAASRLPKWPDLATHQAAGTFLFAGALLSLALIEAVCVLLWLLLAITRRDYQRVGPEPQLHARVTALQAYHERAGATGLETDRKLLRDIQNLLVESYVRATPANRNLNQRRYKYRARASLHLIRSLIWALGATTVIFVGDKLGFLPRMMP
jgi:hypothetical protein